MPSLPPSSSSSSSGGTTLVPSAALLPGGLLGRAGLWCDPDSKVQTFVSLAGWQLWPPGDSIPSPNVRLALCGDWVGRTGEAGREMITLELRRCQGAGFNWQVSPTARRNGTQTPRVRPQDATYAQARSETHIYRAPSGGRVALQLGPHNMS